MISKRTIIVALAALNLLLLAALLLSSYSLPKAEAQGVAAAGNFIAVTCKVDVNFDALCLLDLPERRLHFWTPERTQTGKLEYRGNRDLMADFRR